MRRMRRMAAGVVLGVALLVGVPATQTGCTTTQKQIAYRTLQTIAVAQDLAYRAYADAVIAGRVSLRTQVQVRAAKRKFDLAFRAAVDTASGNLNALAPEDIQKIADELAAALAAAIGGH